MICHGPPTPAGAAALDEVARSLTRLVERLRTSPPGSLADAVVECAVEHVPNARWASVTTLRSGHLRTLAHTSPRAREADALQHRMGSGPCLDAVRGEDVVVSGDLAHDPRWPGCGPRIARETGVRSVRARHLGLVGTPELTASLNLYADAPDAFDEHDERTGVLLATYAALGISVAISHQRALNLEAALRTNRDIGTAIGILMARHGVTREQAHELLRLASQDTNRRMSELAREVVEAGELSVARRPAGSATD